MDAAINFYEFIKANPASFKQLTCKNLLFAHYNCPQVDPKHEYFSQCNFITYTFSGLKRIHKSGKSWFLESDTAIFAKKGAYLFEKFENVEHCVMNFFIPDSYLQQIMQEYRTQLPFQNLPAEPSDAVVKLDITATTKAFFQSMVSYFTEPPPENLLELKFKELLLNLISNPRNNGLLAILNNLQAHDRPSLHEVMEENFRYNLSIADFAKISLRSLPTFKREFKTVFNTTPGKWLLRKRLETANLLLNTTPKTISDIACESGFENNTHFSRVFKQEYGKSPIRFRKEKLESVADN